MFARPKPAQSQGRPWRRGVIVAAGLGVVLAVLQLLTPRSALACPSGTGSGTTVGITHRPGLAHSEESIEARSTSARPVSIPILMRETSIVTNAPTVGTAIVGIGPCCPGAAHSSPGCHSICCFASALATLNSGLHRHDGLARYVLPGVTSLLCQNPGPGLRPPRSIA